MFASTSQDGLHRGLTAQVTGDLLDIISIKRKKLLEFYAEELVKMFPARENLQFSLVAGAGSNLYLLPEQVKMVAGTGSHHNLLFETAA